MTAVPTEHIRPWLWMRLRLFHRMVSPAALFCIILVKGLPPFRKEVLSVEHPAEFVVMQFARPGGNLLPIAMLLFDRSADRLLVQGRDDFEGIADRDDVEVLRSFIAQLADESEQMSGAAMLQELEDKLSNNVRITERQPVSVLNLVVSFMSTILIMHLVHKISGTFQR